MPKGQILVERLPMNTEATADKLPRGNELRGTATLRSSEKLTDMESPLGRVCKLPLPQA